MSNESNWWVNTNEFSDDVWAISGDLSKSSWETKAIKGIDCWLRILICELRSAEWELLSSNITLYIKQPNNQIIVGQLKSEKIVIKKKVTIFT